MLRNVKESLPTTWPKRVAELKQLALRDGRDVTLSEYLEHTGLDLTDVYYGGHSWTDLRVAASVAEQPIAYDVTGDRSRKRLEKRIRSLLRGTGRLLHVDDRNRVDTWLRFLSSEAPPTGFAPTIHDRRLLEMLALIVFSPSKKNEFSSLEEALALLWSRDRDEYPIRDELRQLLPIVAENRTHQQWQLSLNPDIPLRSHAFYTRDEVFAAFGVVDVVNPGSYREGVYFDRDNDVDILFITLQKTEKDFSPQTRYRDYAISDTLFHWESQHVTTVESPTGQRYINQRPGEPDVVLFVRETNKTPDGRTAPFFCCGLADYLSHRQSAPIQITWRLRTPLPGDVFAAYRAAVA